MLVGLDDVDVNVDLIRLDLMEDLVDWSNVMLEVVAHSLDQSTVAMRLIVALDPLLVTHHVGIRVQVISLHARR